VSSASVLTINYLFMKIVSELLLTLDRSSGETMTVNFVVIM